MDVNASPEGQSVPAENVGGQENDFGSGDLNQSASTAFVVNGSVSNGVNAPQQNDWSPFGPGGPGGSAPVVRAVLVRPVSMAPVVPTLPVDLEAAPAQREVEAGAPVAEAADLAEAEVVDSVAAVEDDSAAEAGVGLAVYVADAALPKKRKLVRKRAPQSTQPVQRQHRSDPGQLGAGCEALLAHRPGNAQGRVQPFPIDRHFRRAVENS